MKNFISAIFVIFVLNLGGGGYFAQTTVIYKNVKDSTFVVPAGVTSIDVKIWGAGGGGELNFSSGGSGAFVKGTLAVSPGQTYVITVGGGGKKATNSGAVTGGYAGGGNSGNYAASGGGYSGIFITTKSFSNARAIAAGGGGGGGSNANRNGGAGGGPNGTQGGGTGGGGGTTTAGGAASANSSTEGGQLQGGNGGTGSGGAGGGGGYYGGGGGGNNKAGGGGSSYTSLLTSVTNTVGTIKTNGTTAQAPGSGETGYVAGVGNGGKTGGGSSANTDNGGNGLVIITYTVSVSADYFCELSDISKTTWCAGETANVSVKVKNSGLQNWVSGDNIKLVAKWNSGSWVEGQAIVLNKDTEGTYTVSMIAPASGTHTLSFDLKKGSDLFSDNANGIGPGNTVLSNTSITVNGLPTANAGGNKSVSCLGSIQLGINTTLPAIAAATQTPSHQYLANNNVEIRMVSTDDFTNNTSGPTSVATAYNNYTASHIMTAPKGSSFTLSITTFRTGAYGVWIDWNNNGTFDDTELIVKSAGTNTAAGTYTFTINVPITATEANCRMRIRTKGNDGIPYSTGAHAGSGNAIGETEDYTVRVGNAYTYSWFPSDFLNATNISNPTVSNITEDKTYTLEVTDNKTGCKATDNAAVTVNPSSLTSSLNISKTNICHGASVTLSGTVSNASGAWSLDLSNGGGTVNGTGNTAWSKEVIPTATTTYSISSITSGGCAGSATDTKMVTLPPKNSALAGNNESATCEMSGNNPIYFYALSGNYIGSINPKGRTGTITMSTTVDVAGVKGACLSADPNYNTAYMGRIIDVNGTNFTGGDTDQSVDIVLAYTQQELEDLKDTALVTIENTTDNINLTDLDNVPLGITKISGEDNNPCNTNNVVSFIPATGKILTNPNISNAGYVSFSVSSFSHFNIHGVNNNSPLPITLTSFAGNCKDNGVQLVWTTATESNVNHFEIYRSRNGQSWDKVIDLNAVGNSSTANTYHVTDSKGIETMYYKLRSVDNDGRFEDFNPISVRCNIKGQIWNLHPVPATTQSTITIETDKAISDNIVIMDMNGRAIQTKAVNLEIGVNYIILDVQHLIKGTYIVKMNSETEYKPLKLMKL